MTEPVALKVKNDSVGKLSENAINISWSEDSTPPDVAQTFNVTIITSDGSIIDTVIDLTENYYFFSAPNDALPCEVYNFSVTATPVGATYTGDGCSVPSPVFSRMLPSLPDISSLESSLNTTLVLTSSIGAGFQLEVTFLVRYALIKINEYPYA